MVVVVAILVGWLLLSVPVALVLGRVLRSATEVSAPVDEPRAGGSFPPAVPPKQRDTGAGPRAA